MALPLADPDDEDWEGDKADDDDDDRDDDVDEEVNELAGNAHVAGGAGLSGANVPTASCAIAPALAAFNSGASSAVS